MSQSPNASRRDRLNEFFRRLQEAPPADTHDAAFSQIASILNAVEDEMTSISNNPETWESDGRMYPPQPDNRRVVPGRPKVTRYRSKAHNTFIGDNGSIEIIAVATGQQLFGKAGADGQVS